ncbi:MAG: transposase [Thermoanaerobaculaceae bacterium]
MKRFACRCLGLQSFLQQPGDGRRQGQIPAADLMWAQLAAEVLRYGSFHSVERLVRSAARRRLGVSRRFGDDALAYFSERLNLEVLRSAAIGVVRRVKRNKAFDASRFIGLALDGTGAARSERGGCALCHPRTDAEGQPVGHVHHFSLISIVGTGLVLPFDVEAQHPGEGELPTSTRLLQRAVSRLGRRYASYVVGDGAYAVAPFLHAANACGLHVVARLKGNLPTLHTAAQARFATMPPTLSFREDRDVVEVWDADDFDPWDSLAWPSVRVLRYRQHKPGGAVVEAFWLTDFSTSQVGARALYRMAKSRWQIENGAFNDGKNRYGLERIRHHTPTSVVATWLVVCLAIMIERLYRLRYLHRGTHQPRTAIELHFLFWLALGRPSPPDSS